MRNYFLIILLLIIPGVRAQNNPNPPSLDSLAAQANNAYLIKNYGQAIEFINKILTYPEAQENRPGLFNGLASCYSLIGNADSALFYLEQSIRAGNSEYRQINNATDFEFLRKNFPERFNAMIALAKEMEKSDLLTKCPIAVLAYDNYTGLTDISKYKWLNYHQPVLDTLRERYQLAKITQPGNTEFEKITLLLDWVSHRWEHRSDTCANDYVLAILAGAEKGARFCCGTYAQVLENCLVAMGYPARFVGLMRQGGYKIGSGHGCVEVWSNRYQKWILLDAQNDAWWESGGIPLSAFECRRLFVNDKGNDLVFKGQRKENDYSLMKSEWIVYFYHLFYYDDPGLKDSKGYSGLELVTDSITPELFTETVPSTRGAVIDSYDEVYPRLNQTKISFRPINIKMPSDSLEIVLSHTTPYYDKFFVRINGADWKESNDTLLWILDKGVNVIEAKAVNAAGIEGKISRIVLRNNIGSTLR
ncbi:MAG: transglutaminase-like domain-containing protein [candidate division Zixibacteria bacterium]|nr:transglutaminase-like domain-containing protein [candidate division Zixibacteria bacterium]